MQDKASTAVSFKVMLGEKEYLKIIASNIINRFGDSIDAVAFGWLVYQLTGSREWLAVIMGVNMLPTVLFPRLFWRVSGYKVCIGSGGAYAA